MDGSGGRGGVLDYAYAEFIGRAFEAEGDVHGRSSTRNRRRFLCLAKEMI